jgi:hypothetical protein
MYNYDYLNPIPYWRKKCEEKPKVCIRNTFQSSEINTNTPNFGGNYNFRIPKKSYPIFWIMY